MREEGDGGYKLVDYQELELFNNRSHEVLASQASIMATLKKTLGKWPDNQFRFSRHLVMATLKKTLGKPADIHCQMRFSWQALASLSVKTHV